MADMSQFEAIITAALGSSNEQRKAAEQALESLKQQPDAFIASLSHVLSTAADPSVRVLAGVLLRQQLDIRQQCWDKASEPARLHVRGQLLQLLTKSEEDSRVVRRTVAEAVGSLAVLTLPLGTWPEFLPSLFQLSTSTVPAHRMSVALILAKLVEMIPASLQGHLDQIKTVLFTSLQDSNREVGGYAVSAVVSLLISITGPQRKQLVESVPLIFAVISSFVQSNDEDKICTSFESLCSLVSCDAVFFKPYLQDIVKLSVQMATNQSFEPSTRRIAIEFLLALAEHGQGMIRKANYFVQMLVPVAHSFLLEIDEHSDWHSVADEFELDQDNFNLGLEATDRLAEALGGKVFLPVALPLIQSSFTNANYIHRHAALNMLSEMALGCLKFMKPKVDEVLQNFVFPGLRDTHHRVRYAAVNCLAQLCNDYAPDFQREHHQVVMQNLLLMLADPVPRVCSQAALCVVDVCAGIEQEEDAVEIFKPYIDATLGQLLLLLRRQPSFKAVESTLTAVASVAHISKDSFIQYYDHFMPMVKTILTTATSNDARLVRGKAMECVGIIGNAVGRDKFAADALEVLHLLMQTQQTGLSNDDPQYSYMVQTLARICECVGEAFVPYLQYVIPPLLVSASAEGGRMVPDLGVDDEPEEGVERVVVAIRGQGNMRIEYNTAILEEKAMACNMLYQYANRLRGHFAPYVEQVLGVLAPLVRYRYNEGVRVAAVSALPALLTCAHEHNISAANPQSAQQQAQNNVVVRALFEHLFEPMADCMRLEPDIEQECNIVRSFTECVELLHEPLAIDQLKCVSEVVKDTMIASSTRRQERVKQLQADDVDEETVEKFEVADSDEAELLGLLIDFTNRMVKNAKDSFMPVFHEQLAQQISLYLTSASSSQPEQVTAICIFDDIIEHGGAFAQQYIPSFLPFILSHACDKDFEIRQACLYGIGVMATLAPASMFVPHRDQLLAQLVPMIESADARTEDAYPSTCNAVSAIVKIMMSTNGNADGLDQASMWPRVLSWLPLAGDEDEACSVHSRVLSLVEQNRAEVLGVNNCNLPILICIFSTVVFSIEVSNEALNKRIAAFWRQIVSSAPALVQQLQLDDKQKAKLTDCMTYM